MGKFVSGLLMVATAYVVYRVGYSDGRKDSDAVWREMSYSSGRAHVTRRPHINYSKVESEE